MAVLSSILKTILNESSVNSFNIANAIDKHKRIIIRYRSEDDTSANGERYIDIFAYGLSKAGNPVIRAFQPFGDTTTRVPSWKFFRVDRITDWKETNETFTYPYDNFRGYGEFNPNDDRSMSVVYKIASFSNNNTDNTSEGESIVTEA